jgi:hypothetical protein
MAAESAAVNLPQCATFVDEELPERGDRSYERVRARPFHPGKNYAWISPVRGRWAVQAKPDAGWGEAWVAAHASLFFVSQFSRLTWSGNSYYIAERLCSLKDRHAHNSDHIRR